MTLEQFKAKWLGKPADFDGQYGNQCVDLYRFYVKEVLGFPQSPGVGGASEIWDSADPNYYDFIFNTPMGTPQSGDIVIWNRKMGGGFGHVAIALDGSSITNLKLLETDGTTGTGLVQLKDRSYSNVIGWLHPKENMANELETCMADRLKFWQERDTARADLEALNTQIAGYKSRITDLTNQLGTAQAEVKNREEQISRLKVDMLTLEEGVKRLTDQVYLKQQEINQAVQDKATLAIEVEQLKVQVETLKSQATQGEVTISFKDLIKLILQQKITIKK